jgi:hypothetical protein
MDPLATPLLQTPKILIIVSQTAKTPPIPLNIISNLNNKSKNPNTRNGVDDESQKMRQVELRRNFSQQDYIAFYYFILQPLCVSEVSK